MVNRCVWREKCLEYGGKKREVDKKLIVKKILNVRKKQNLRMFWIRSTDDHLVTNKK